jgi:hypothetical protein
MDNDKSKQSDKPELQTKPEIDTIGMWFAAAVLLTVLAAGIIIYRTANDDIHMAASDTILAAAFAVI